MPPVDLSSKTITRLQKHAIPLIDTFDTVIGKLLDVYERRKEEPARQLADRQTGIQAYDPSAPPNLAHTVVKSIRFCGTTLDPHDTHWNRLMHLSIRKVAESGLSAERLKSHVLANNVVGRKEEDGYKYIPDVGLSVQGQDANGAWKTVYHLASIFHLPVEVTFAWKSHPKAAIPGTTGSFTVNAK